MKVVLFLIDAFRYDYISEETTPYIMECIKEGKYIQHIIPSAGFCERTEIFTGLEPNESGFFTAIGFDPQNSPYNNSVIIEVLGNIENILRNIFNVSDHSKLKRGFRIISLKLLRIFFEKKKLKPYNIPFSFLKYFNLTEDEIDFSKDEYLNQKSTFKIVNELGGKTFFDSFTSLGKASNGTDNDRVNIAISTLEKEEHLFTPIYIGAVDAIGHIFGPKSTEMSSELKKIDTLLKISVARLLDLDEDTRFIFLGDHGMTDIEVKIDINPILLELAKSLKLKPNKDFIYFLDSTLLRVWFLSDKAKKSDFANRIKNDLLLKKCGRIINKKMAEKYSIPYNDRRYGDISWWANSGVLIFPDFFHNSRPYKGMHGYSFEDETTHGTCLLFGNSIKPDFVPEMRLNKTFNLINEILRK